MVMNAFEHSSGVQTLLETCTSNYACRCIYIPTEKGSILLKVLWARAARLGLYRLGVESLAAFAKVAW